jgi:hypothetical protein
MKLKLLITRSLEHWPSVEVLKVVVDLEYKLLFHTPESP